MTWALAREADLAQFPTTAGISARAINGVLGAMAKIAQSDGTYRYGLRASKIAEITKYSLSTTRRILRVLHDIGVLVKERIGGGRASTKWRIDLDKLASYLPKKTRQPVRPDTPAVLKKHGLGPRAGMVSKMFSRPRRQTVAVPPPGTPREPLEVCEHGGDAGTWPGGIYKDPFCRIEHGQQAPR